MKKRKECKGKKKITIELKDQYLYQNHFINFFFIELDFISYTVNMYAVCNFNNNQFIYRRKIGKVDKKEEKKKHHENH